MTVQAICATLWAWLSIKLGVLLPVLIIFAICMIVDYITGYLASAKEALEHPGDPNYGWSSKKGAIGIYKKFGYIFVVAISMIIDVLIKTAGNYIGYDVPAAALFGLLSTCWYISNECLSIIENAGRMGAPIPKWLARYIAVLKKKIDNQVNTEVAPVQQEEES